MAKQVIKKWQGKSLKNAEILLDEIGGKIARETAVIGLAVRLLSKVGGGHNFLDDKKSRTTTNTDLAKMVLMEWVRLLPEEAYGERLLEVLRSIKENALAMDYHEVLMDESHNHEEAVSVASHTHQSTTDSAASISAPPQKQENTVGRILSSADPLLVRIADYFGTDERADNLATFLLQDIGAGGPQFIEALREETPAITWKAVSKAVLRKWCTSTLEPSGSKLLEYFKQMNEMEAFRTFKDDLMTAK